VFRFALLGSGSSGNATLITSATTKILIDDGFSLRQIQNRLSTLGETLDGLNGIFITHEHSDHVSGIGVLGRKKAVPVFMTQGTKENLPPVVGNVPRIECFEAGESITVGDLTVQSFSVSHDAADPVSFTISSAHAKLGFATDFGHPSQLVRARLTGSHALILEANYCPDLLRKGPYPPQIQQRIRGRNGHMSNQDMTRLLDDLLHDQLRTVVLVHLSENNNRPDLVQKMAAQVLHGHPAQLYIAEQDKPTPFFEVWS